MEQWAALVAGPLADVCPAAEAQWVRQESKWKLALDAAGPDAAESVHPERHWAEVVAERRSVLKDRALLREWALDSALPKRARAAQQS